MAERTVLSDAIILVGGRGTRLQSVVSDRPKPMAEVAGRPFAEWMVLALRKQGVRRVVFATGHMADAFQNHFGDGCRWDVEVAYSHESEPLGTGGAVRLALDVAQSDRLLVLNGDSYCPLDLARLQQTHVKRGARASIWLVRVNDCRRFGTVQVDGDGAVSAFLEKQDVERAGLINAGIYLLDRDLVEAMPADRAVSIEREVFPDLIGRGLYAVAGEGPFIDIGTPESYTQADSFVDWDSLTQQISDPHLSSRILK